MSHPPDASNRRLGQNQVAWRVSLKCGEWRQVEQLAALHASRGSITINSSRSAPLGSPVEAILELPDGRRVKLRGAVHQIGGQPRTTAETRSSSVSIKLDAQSHAELRQLASTAVASKKGTHGQVAQPQEPAVVRTRRPPGTIAPAVGVDFGTSYTSISVAIGDRVMIIPDEGGRTLHPSLVAFPEKGPLQVGWDARRMLSQDPRRVVPSAKRLLGRKFSDPSVAGLLQMAAFRTSQGVNEAIVVEIDEEHRSIVEICSAVMSHVRSVAEKYLGTSVKQAVFTVPVGFGPAQREALKRAAKLARFDLIELLEEPVAGALTYGIGLKKNEIVAVYDFGGGTFDFSLLDFVHDQFRVLGTQGDPWLGGDDFDSTLAQHVADGFWRGHQVELRQRVVEWQRLLIACERVKRKLSSAPEAELYVEAVVDSPTRIDIRQTVSREEFDRLCKELVERSLSVCNEALAALKLEPSDVTELVLTGGVSSIPMVREAVSQLFQREIKQTVNPEQAVALGAGLRAAQCVNHAVLGVAASPE